MSELDRDIALSNIERNIILRKVEV
jgi:hypothetical protein